MPPCCSKLTSLMKKSAAFVWGSTKFDQASKKGSPQWCHSSVQYPSPSAQVQLNTDASGNHIGAMLKQWENKDQPWTPVSFYSKGFNSAQLKYSTTTASCSPPIWQSKSSVTFSEVDNSSCWLTTNRYSYILAHLTPQRTPFPVTGEGRRRQGLPYHDSQ